MLAHTIHPLLILSMLGCPLFCAPWAEGAAADCCVVEGPIMRPAEPRDTCCSGGHGEHTAQASSDDESKPAAPGDGESGQQSCQCICGGAVLAHSLEVEDPAELPFAWGAVALSAPATGLAGWDESATTPLFLLIDDRTATPGRHLRCLYMSYLC